MEHEAEGREKESRPGAVKRMPPKPHPKPEPGAPPSLNHALRQELWYVDTMMAAPFRTMRRVVARGGQNPLMEGLDEVLWAWEGMSRLPVKVLQAALGEELGRPKSSGGAGAAHDPKGEGAPAR